MEAVTDVRYRAFRRADITALLHKYPVLFDTLSTVWIDEKTQVDQLALALGRLAADERIARLIVNLYDRLAQWRVTRTQTMEFPLRQHHIADATGLTLVHVSKTLSEFRRSGLIEIVDRTLVVHDLSRLRRIAQVQSSPPIGHLAPEPRRSASV